MSLTLSDCMTLSKVLNFSQLQFSAKQQIFNKIGPSAGYTNNPRTIIQVTSSYTRPMPKSQTNGAREIISEQIFFLAGHEFIP